MGRRGEEEGEGGDRKEEGERKVPQRLHYPQPPLDGVCQPRLLAAPQKAFSCLETSPTLAPRFQ